ncbi:MAG: hypothetical protein UY72_C0080G0010 [Candidatus Uhrbacteria bacterium GW2011_GWD2_52_7]|uniref:CMP/dCMP-type deaminase domain-containing protein n=1 Tax=Candidatus Uhrbacteria bacterium GW2011_GWD2_52_7 TaxID=1618989 RepID=A0A0G1ZJN8_9BACT|nr:MAG: hypothetical protein UY72_C0080G0010 [Candidatus Uhrbacteria bacterium GW2011_GWD2_52_7]
MLVAYIPVLHQGYLELFRRYDEVGILGPDVLAQFTSVTRDLRAVDPFRMKSAIEGLGLVTSVRVLTLDDLLELRNRELVMPDDDISHHLAETHQLHVQFASLFLRWDKMAATAFKTPASNRSISHEACDLEIMALAKDESRHSADWWRQIGAVIVKDGAIIAKGHNHHLPTDFHLAHNGDPRSNFNAGEHIDLSTAMHGEAGLIARCAKDGIALNGASIFVTTFPCPNCARLIVSSGITRVYYTQGYSLLDAEQLFAACNVETIFVS